ncbi:MAG TPA: 23S rRNA (adenine(2503)-C(2))-methyltransferase RlmN [Sorangium sp.]|nr:23S rRNA (adenine(2503)-C(2))-methyltransferase RlmN [Sorangium sp.]
MVVKRLTLVDPPPPLANHDAASLAQAVQRQTGVSLTRCERLARRALGVAFATDGDGDAAWSREALSHAGIGRWAQAALLALSPRLTLELVEQAPSSDGTVRLLLRCRDGAVIESVIIPAEAGRERGRTTLCLSSQVGCARACTFCETGTLGLSRQLSSSEIVDQYRIAARLCARPDRPWDKRTAASHASVTATAPGRRAPQARQAISNIVFMGMGEPFDNLAAVSRAIALLTLQQGFSFAPSRITVSTVGVADKLAQFFQNTRAELAISINAPDDRRRNLIMPINQRHNLAALRAALLAAMPQNARVLFQYALFNNFNDSAADAQRLAAYVRPIRCRVNVIAANPGPDPTLVAPSPQKIDAFINALRARGVTTLLRRPRGRDVGGACGQLAGAHRKRRAAASITAAEDVSL